MRIAKLTKSDFLKLAKEKGFIYGKIVMDSRGFINLCHMHGFNLNDFRDFFS
jgi:hypothetical protein